MGGLGSGKHWKGRRKRSDRLSVLDLPDFDISLAVKKFNENPGYYRWGNIRFFIANNYIRLDKTQGEELKTSVVEISPMPCNYGGTRYFGLCPGCRTRVRILYLLNIYFGCRHCLRLSYRSQNVNLAGRLRLKRRKIGEKINHDEDTKPKWMRQKTFVRLREQYLDLYEKKLIADCFSLRDRRSVDELFAKYGCAFVASEAWEREFCRF